MIKQIFKRHYGVVILAVAIGALTAGPQILAIRGVPNFQGIYKIVNNDELYYLARGKEIIDGHTAIANPYLYEHKTEPPVQIGLPDYLLAKPLALLGIEIHQGYLFYDFVLPALGTIFTYGIVYFLTRSILVSFLGAAFLHLNLFLYSFNRSPSPQLNFLFWLSLFWLWLKFIERPTTAKAILVGSNLGLLFYIYPYYWTYYVVFFGVYIFLTCLFKQSLPAKKYLIILAVALLAAGPYFINLWQSLSLAYYDETLTRIGLITTHFPSGRKIIMWGGLATLLYFLACWRKIISLNRQSLFLLSGTLATMIVTNQHLITGKNLQFSSHYWELSVFIFVFTSLYIMANWLKRDKFKTSWSKLSLILLTLFVFYRPAAYIATLAADGGPHYTARDIAEQRYAPVFDWLRNQTLKDDVVFANNEISVLTPIYTANNVFFQGLAGLHFMSNEEIWERFVLNNFWDQMDADYLVKNKFSIWGAHYQTLYDHNQSKNKVRKFFGLPLEEYVKYPPAAIEEFLARARPIKQGDFLIQIRKYRVDYFVQDKTVDRWPIEQLTFLIKVFERDNLLIYKVN